MIWSFLLKSLCEINDQHTSILVITGKKTYRHNKTPLTSQTTLTPPTCFHWCLQHYCNSHECALPLWSVLYLGQHSWHVFLTFYPSEKVTLKDFIQRKKSPINQKPIQDQLFFRPLTIQGNLYLNQNGTANIWDIPMSAQNKHINITVILFSLNSLTNFYLATFNSGLKLWDHLG